MRLSQSLLVLAVLGLLFSGCDLFEKRDRSFQDDPKIEVFPLSETVDEPQNGNTSAVTLEIQLIGEQRSSDLPVSLTVDDSSTAVSGTHFNLPATSATIPANSSQTEVEVQVLDNDADDAGTNHLLYISLQGSEGVQAAENLRTHTLTIRGLDED